MTRLLIALLALAAPSFAFTRGGGSPLTDCLAEFSGTPANRPASRPRDIRCIDNDSTCDDDPTPGVRASRGRRGKGRASGRCRSAP
jgi:hypothetical protein